MRASGSGGSRLGGHWARPSLPAAAPGASPSPSGRPRRARFAGLRPHWPVAARRRSPRPPPNPRPLPSGLPVGQALHQHLVEPVAHEPLEEGHVVHCVEPLPGRLASSSALVCVTNPAAARGEAQTAAQRVCRAASTVAPPPLVLSDVRCTAMSKRRAVRKLRYSLPMHTHTQERARCRSSTHAAGKLRTCMPLVSTVSPPLPPPPLLSFTRARTRWATRRRSRAWRPPAGGAARPRDPRAAAPRAPTRGGPSARPPARQ